MSIDPRLIALFCILFISLGIFNLIMGRRRMLQAQQSSSGVAWYKQINILVSIEYFLLALAFLMNLALNYHWLPPSLYGIVIPFYILVLIASGALAGVVIFRGLSRKRRQQANAVTITSNTKEQELSAEERAYHAQKRRERRKKAAQARRRRAGKA
jgi:phosphatidylglycerophosphate synthase